MSTPTAAPAGVAGGYARLRAGSPSAVRGRGALIWVEGPDAATFLQGLLSNDVVALRPGGACAALLLDAKGHIQADVRVHDGGDGAYTLLLRPELAEGVAATLHRYHFSEDLEILGPEEVDLLTLSAEVTVPDGTAQIAVPGALPGSLDIVVDDARTAIVALGIEEAPPEALEMARIAAGIPRVGIDTGPSTLVQEVGFEGEAVSFGKGCYLGQETVARIAFRGRVNRHLRGLLLSEPAAVGAVLTSEGREVGRLTSVAVTPDLGSIGLAVIRHEVALDTDVGVEGIAASARVVDLPFRAR